MSAIGVAGCGLVASVGPVRVTVTCLPYRLSMLCLWILVWTCVVVFIYSLGTLKPIYLIREFN